MFEKCSSIFLELFSTIFQNGDSTKVLEQNISLPILEVANSTSWLIIFKNILEFFKGKINFHLLFKSCSRTYLVLLQVLQMFKSYSGICLEHVKNKHVITRWMI